MKFMSYASSVMLSVYSQYMLVCVVLIEIESAEPAACETGSKPTATVTRRRHRPTSFVPSKDAVNFHTENGFHQHRSLRRQSLRHHSVVAEDLYCPMNGVRVKSGHRLPGRNSAARNTPGNLLRACSDETLSLHSHSRRLQQAHRETPTHTDRRMSVLDVASATRRSHTGRERHRNKTAAAPSSSRSRRTVSTSNRPDLLCAWKEHDDWDSVSPQGKGRGIADFIGHSSPQENDVQRQHTGANGTFAGTIPVSTQSPQSIISDGSPGSHYPIAPAASPVTLNSVVFSPPPYTLVSSSTTAVWSTAASFPPPRTSVMDSRSNPDSGYSSKIYRCQGTGPVVDTVASCPERVKRPVETGVNVQSRVCSSFPDVVVDRPVYYSGNTPTLPQIATYPAVSSEHQQDVGLEHTNLDLMAYSETNLVVSPHRAADHRQSRMPMQLADENSLVEESEALSPLSLDSVNFIAERISDFSVSSPANNGNVSVSAIPPEASLFPDVPQSTRYVSSPEESAAVEQFLHNMNSVSELGSPVLGIRTLSCIAEDVRQINGERESYQEAGDYQRSPLSVSAEHSFNHVIGTDDIPQIEDDAVDHRVLNDVQLSHLQIGRCTTV